MTDYYPECTDLLPTQNRFRLFAVRETCHFKSKPADVTRVVVYTIVAMSARCPLVHACSIVPSEYTTVLRYEVICYDSNEEEIFEGVAHEWAGEMICELEAADRGTRAEMLFTRGAFKNTPWVDTIVTLDSDEYDEIVANLKRDDRGELDTSPLENAWLEQLIRDEGENQTDVPFPAIPAVAKPAVRLLNFVTNDEYAQFKPHVYLESDRNKAVTLVSYDDAVAYAIWLSRATGRKLRLPTQLELQAAYATFSADFSQHPLKTQPNVGSFGKTTEGVSDLLGVVSTWVSGVEEVERLRALWSTDEVPGRALNTTQNTWGSLWVARPDTASKIHIGVGWASFTGHFLGFRLVEEL